MGNPNELRHYGVLGMRWGVSRMQDPNDPMHKRMERDGINGSINRVDRRFTIEKTSTKDSYRHGKKVRSIGDKIDRNDPRYSSSKNTKSRIIKNPDYVKKTLTPEQKERAKKAATRALGVIGVLGLTEIALRAGSNGQMGIVDFGALAVTAAKLKVSGGF